jgi:predicted metal-binding membrane protein
VAAYAGTHQSGSARRRAHASAAFVLGYLIPWFAVGVVIYAIVEGVRSLHLGALSWGQAGPYLAGGVILGAALYQLTTVKDVALRHCRDLSTLLGRARLGFFGALRTGIDHGVVCVSCCWAMMAALFALGMMSIGWMVFIAVLIAAEKLLPSQAVAKRGVAVLLALLAIAVAFVPDKVPGLMPPGSMEMSSTAEAPR